MGQNVVKPSYFQDKPTSEPSPYLIKMIKGHSSAPVSVCVIIMLTLFLNPHSLTLIMVSILVMV